MYTEWKIAAEYHDSYYHDTHKSPLPLTDPREAVPQAHRVVHKCGRSVW